MPTVEEFKVRYKAFNDVDESMIALILGDAALEVSRKAWGKFYNRGVLALAAHLLALSEAADVDSSSVSGVVTSEKAGEVQVSYASAPISSLDDAYYSSTVYGQEYMRLRSLISIGVRVVS
jgi:hypothetical protein